MNGLRDKMGLEGEGAVQLQGSQGNAQQQAAQAQVTGVDTSGALQAPRAQRFRR